MTRRVADKSGRTGSKRAATDMGIGEPERLEVAASEILPSSKTKAVKLYRKAAEFYEKTGDEKSRRRLLDIAATVLADEGWESREEDDLSKARRKAMKALEIYPDHVDAINLLALIHADSFEHARAKDLYKQAIEAAIKGQGGVVKVKETQYWSQLETRPYMRARHGYGFCLAYLGLHKEALDQFKLLLKIDPRDHVGARFLLADLYHYVNDRKKAEKYYKEQGSFDAPFTYALLLHVLGRESEARLTLKKAFNTSPIVRSMLTDYLYCFVLWETLDSYKWGTFPPLSLHRNALETACNANADKIEDYETQIRVEAAYNFCNFSGPLWLKYEDSYDFLKAGNPVG